ncbi:MAG: efflux RND transporter periplasmic adaptor subunit [Gemmataceae bacterium]|nr:efflux RND transporter periplasmic adaptor subunit [Gemmataceae bacterium]
MMSRMVPLLAVAAIGCGAASAIAPPAPKIVVAGPERVALPRAVRQPGHVEAYARTPLAAKIAGYVRAVHADIGDRVKAGQLLAELAEPELEQEFQQKRAIEKQSQAEIHLARKSLEAATAAVTSARATVEESKAGRKRVQASFERWKSEADRVGGLVDRKVIDAQTRDETLSQYRVAEAALEEVEARIRSSEAAAAESAAKRDRAAADVAVAEAKAGAAAAEAGRLAALLGYARITAPFAGVVTQRNVEVGHLLAPGRGEPLFVIDMMDPIRVYVEVSENDAAALAEKAAARVQVPALGDEMTGTVSRTSWALDPKSRTLRTAIDLPNPQGRLRPGMYAMATLTIDPPARWVVPVGAVQRIAETQFVFLMRDGKAVRTPVRVGYSDGKQIEVLELQTAEQGKPAAWRAWTGIEKLVTVGAAGLTDGSMVEQP